MNSSFGSYTPPSSLSPETAAIVQQALQTALPPMLFAALSNDSGGAPVVALLSYSNFGSATTAGVEVGASYLLPAGWRSTGLLHRLSFQHQRHTRESVVAQHPSHQFSAGVAYEHGRVAGGLRYRWVDSFPWLAGIYRGQVPSYGITDLNGSYRLSKYITTGADVANLLDNDHYEAFGGDLLGRRALVHVTYSW